MLLSFIVPVYNNADAFEVCLAALGPLLADGTAEVVAVDDGSDVPLTVSDKNVRVVRTEHRGAAAARNAGIAAASGDFVWPVDADDVIGTDGIGSLLDELRSMPEEACFFHIGDLVAVAKAGAAPSTGVPDAGRTTVRKPLTLLAPRNSITDHTTNIIRRQWLEEHPDLRYPEDMSLLEDAVFSLRVIERAGQCLCNETYRFYRRCTYHLSSTAGAWASQRSLLFTQDICKFFLFLRQYADLHATDSDAVAYYRRMRYVYLRVAAVKGCPRRDLERLVAVVGKPRRCPMPVYFFIAFVCRIIRPKR